MNLNIINKSKLSIVGIALVLAHVMQAVTAHSEPQLRQNLVTIDNFASSQDKTLQLLSGQYQLSRQRINQFIQDFREDDQQNRKTVRVLSLDGGGIRGIGTLALLATLEMKTGKKVYELFDRIYGTSTGGLMGILFAFGKSATEVLDIYMDGASRIFKRGWFDSVTNPGGLIRAAYDPSGIEGLINELLPGKSLKDAILPVTVTTINEKTRKVELLSSEDEETRDVSVLEAGRATSAAPTYFPQMLVNTKTRSFMGSDGGTLVNNPAMQAYLHTHTNNKNDKLRIKLLSLGTGVEAASSLDPNAGKLSLLPKVTKVLMDPHAELVDQNLKMLAAIMRDNTFPAILDYNRFQFDLPHAIDLAAVDEATKNKLLRLAVDYTFNNDDFKQYIRELNFSIMFGK